MPDTARPVGELVERALDGARALAIEEAKLVFRELEEDAHAAGRAALVAGISMVCLSVSIAWGGVALALAWGLGPSSLASIALALGVTTIALAVAGARGAPRVLLAGSRRRLEARAERVARSLR